MFESMAAAIAARMHNDTVQPLQRGEKHKGIEGSVYYDPPTPLGQPLACNVQPYSSELALKEYGLEVKANIRLFAIPDDRLQLNALMAWCGARYRVTALPPPRSLAVALLEVDRG